MARMKRLLLSFVFSLLVGSLPAWAEEAEPHWTWAGWGGGGWFWCTAFDASDPNTLYMGGDVIGIYKSTDCAESWSFANRGLHNYAVYAIAASKSAPQTVYAMTTDGMARSVDGGAHWKPLEQTRKNHLHLSAKRSGSVQPIAIDPTNDRRVVVGSGEGRLYETTDGGDTWKELPYQSVFPPQEPDLQAPKRNPKRPISSVLISEANPNQLFVSHLAGGLFRSDDRGLTWKALGVGVVPVAAQHITGGTAKSPNRLYATFGRQGVYVSLDGGETWNQAPGELPKDTVARMTAVDPRNPLTVHLIAKNGHFITYDGGETWIPCRLYERDFRYNPTLPEEPWGRRKSGLLTDASGIAVSPMDPDRIFVAANWNNVISRDGGASWKESARGADISCIHDLRFAKGSVYAAAMDEGLLRSDDNGASWKQLTPKRWRAGLSGHQWRVLPTVRDDGSVRLVSTLSAWKHGSTEFPNTILLSNDNGASFTPVTAGLPTVRPRHNTMWEEGYARALAVDPLDPNVLYLGIDGESDPNDKGAKAIGGVYKSTDGGWHWHRLAAQPGSQRMFYGLAVDPTNPQRIFWGACGKNSGVYRSPDGGATWEKTSLTDWIYNLEVMPSGTVLAGGKHLWISRDHGETWTQATELKGVTICGMAFDPENEQRIWIAGNRWGTSAGEGVWESVDGGRSWANITGDLPNTRPNNLRYNAATKELWAVGPAAFRVRR